MVFTGPHHPTALHQGIMHGNALVFTRPAELEQESYKVWNRYILVAIIYMNLPKTSNDTLKRIASIRARIH